MSGASAKPEVVAVLDVGKTNVKLLAVAPGGTILSSRQAPNEVRRGEPYPSCDVEHIWRWLMAALADVGERWAIQAIVPTAYGSTAALVDEHGLVLPIMDYETDPPPAIAIAYDEAAPWFEECCCAINPGGLTLARQLFWQSRAFPAEFARARWILPFAQYWAWGLTGVPAGEITSLGAQTQLWNPRAGRFSALAVREGWAERFPSIQPAWSVLGTLKPDVVAKCGLPADTPVLCGIHDSNANFAVYLAAGVQDFTLVSTGTWLITFNPGLSLGELAPVRDTVSNTDLEGRPVACARFMGGREYATLAGAEGLQVEPQAADVARLVAGGTMALPSFTDSGGPFPGTGGKGRIVGPRPRTPHARAALASLYVALMTSVDLDLLRSEGQVVVDGGLAGNRLFTSLLAALRPEQKVMVSSEREGTALGAALLWGWRARTAPVPLDLRAVEPEVVPGLAAYAQRWHELAELGHRR